MRHLATVLSLFLFLLFSGRRLAAQQRIDFEGVPAGTILSSVFGDQGSGPIGVDAVHPTLGVNAAVVFDSSNPTGGDLDLGTPNEDFGGPGVGVGGEAGSPFANTQPLGNILIVSEGLLDGNGDGLVDAPNDINMQVSFLFDFSSLGTVAIHGLTTVDVEGPSSIQFLAPGGASLGIEPLQVAGGNGVAVSDFAPVCGVERILVTLTESGGLGEIAFTEECPPMADFSAGPTSGDYPLAVAFTDLSTQIVTGWSWSFGDGGSSVLQNPVHTYTTSGTFTVSLAATGPGGTDIETRVDLVTVTDPPPVAEFVGAPTSGRRPLEVSFTDLSTNPVTAWSWDFGDGGLSSLPDPSHVYTDLGTFTVSLKVTGPGGTDAVTKSSYVVVDGIVDAKAPAPTETVTPEEEADFYAQPRTGPAPLTVSFTNVSRGFWRRSIWDFGDGMGSGLVHPVHTYDTPGTYTVTLERRRDFGAVIDVEVKVDYIVVTAPLSGLAGERPGPRAARERVASPAGATLTTRRGKGDNLSCYSARVVDRGTLWVHLVDAEAYPGATRAVLVGHPGGAAPGSSIPGVGEFLVDVTHPGLWLDTREIGPGLNLVPTSLPADPSLVGGGLVTQVLLVGSEGPRACEAVELRFE